MQIRIRPVWKCGSRSEMRKIWIKVLLGLLNISFAKCRYVDPLIYFTPDPVISSTDPDPTCNNGFIKNIFILNKI